MIGHVFVAGMTWYLQMAGQCVLLPSGQLATVLVQVQDCPSFLCSETK